GLSKVSQMLADKFELVDIDLSRDSEQLGQSNVLVIAGPKRPIPAGHLFAIDQFIMNGGRVAFLIDRQALDLQSFIGRPLTTGVEEMVAYYGVQIEPSMVLDLLNQRVALTQMQGNIRFQTLVAFPPFVRVQDLAQDSMLVKNLHDLTMPFIAPLTLTAKEGVEAKVIARSSEKSWLFENEDSFLVDPQALPTPTEDDFAGPQNLVVTLAGAFSSYYRDQQIPTREEDGQPVAASLFEQSPNTRLAVVGSSLWISDLLPNRLTYVFFANLMDWLAGDDRLVGIRTRTITNRPLEQTSALAKNLIKYGNMFLLPLAFIAFGVVRWRLRLRRKRRGLI
ncbi:MAG: Gldg family protein, partial [Alphaproteobacteria bacterium]